MEGIVPKKPKGIIREDEKIRTINSEGREGEKEAVEKSELDLGEDRNGKVEPVKNLKGIEPDSD